MTDLPRPEVKVTRRNDPATGTPLPNGADVVISRGGRAQSATTEKDGLDGIKELVEKIVNDRRTGEWLP